MYIYIYIIYYNIYILYIHNDTILAKFKENVQLK